MELEVQKFLRGGKSVSDLSKELYIKTNEYENLFLFNYSQTDSPKTNKIVMECRGLVLEKDSWNIISVPFLRFFNYLEAREITSNFDFSKGVACEKVDGSFIQMFWYQHRWYMTTRGTIEGTGKVGVFDITFRQLFYETTKQYPDFWQKIDKNLIYIFELVSPESKVVKYYPERALYLTGLRNAVNFCELSYEMMKVEAKALGVRIPKVYPFKNVSDLLEIVAGLKDLDEGFVCVDYSKQINGNFPRVKVKSPQYIAISHMKESGGRSIRSLMRLIWTGEEGEFMTYFPEFSPILSRLRKAYDEFHSLIKNEVELAKEKKYYPRKEFAIWAQNTSCPSLMFQIYDGKCSDFKQYIDEMLKTKGEKNTAKFVIKAIGINDLNPDMEFESES